MLFGQAWADVNHNGCDTRNDILKRDLVGISYTNSVPCKVQSGNLEDPYTGTRVNFLRGSATSSAVQIDHVVALSDAWQKGAQQLTTEQRTAFANDPRNLQATDGPTNMKKGDGDAATWLPPNKDFRCEYVARQIGVKATYSLWVTQAEHDAMARILANCSGQLAPTDQQASVAPAPAPAPAPAAAQPAPAVPVPASAAPAPAVVAQAPAPVAPAPVVRAPGSCSAGTGSRLLRQLHGGKSRRGRTAVRGVSGLRPGAGPRLLMASPAKARPVPPLHNFKTFQGGKMKKTLTLVVLAGLMLTGCSGKQAATQPTETATAVAAAVRCCYGSKRYEPDPDKATDQLKDLGLKVKAVDTVEDKTIILKRNWQVTSQDPTEGAQVAKGSTVHLGVKHVDKDAEDKAAADKLAAETVAAEKAGG